MWVIMEVKEQSQVRLGGKGTGLGIRLDICVLCLDFFTILITV